MPEQAYRTADPEVIEAWEKFENDYNTVADRRSEMEYAVGRKMYVQRSSGHGSRVVGFERFDSDKDGDLIHHGGCLIVSRKRGHHGGLVVPNLRRKAGKDFERELRSLATPTLTLPGMPMFHLYGDGDTVGIRSASPALWRWEGTIYALWPCDSAPVKDNWESIPLSTYHLAREQKEQASVEG